MRFVDFGGVIGGGGACARGLELNVLVHIGDYKRGGAG